MISDNKTQKEKIVEKEPEDEQVTDEEKILVPDQLRVEDLEKAERVALSMKIKGAERVVRISERDEKEMITKFDNKIFDPGFMQMHTKEITYKLLQEELKKIGLISDLVAEVNAGKEASIYIAHLNGAPLIVKSFLWLKLLIQWY